LKRESLVRRFPTLKLVVVLKVFGEEFWED